MLRKKNKSNPGQTVRTGENPDPKEGQHKKNTGIGTHSEGTSLREAGTKYKPSSNTQNPSTSQHKKVKDDKSNKNKYIKQRC